MAAWSTDSQLFHSHTLMSKVKLLGCYETWFTFFSFSIHLCYRHLPSPQRGHLCEQSNTFFERRPPDHQFHHGQTTSFAEAWKFVEKGEGLLGQRKILRQQGHADRFQNDQSMRRSHRIRDLFNKMKDFFRRDNRVQPTPSFERLDLPIHPTRQGGLQEEIDQELRSLNKKSEASWFSSSQPRIHSLCTASKTPNSDVEDVLPPTTFAGSLTSSTAESSCTTKELTIVDDRGFSSSQVMEEEYGPRMDDQTYIKLSQREESPLFSDDLPEESDFLGLSSLFAEDEILGHCHQIQSLAESGDIALEPQTNGFFYFAQPQLEIEITRRYRSLFAKCLEAELAEQSADLESLKQVLSGTSSKHEKPEQF